MPGSLNKPEDDLYHKLEWVMFLRVIFTSLLLGSTTILQFSEKPFPITGPFIIFYGLIITIFLLSFFYALIFKHIKRKLVFYGNNNNFCYRQFRKHFFISLSGSYYLFEYAPFQERKHGHGRALQYPVRHSG